MKRFWKNQALCLLWHPLKSACVLTLRWSDLEEQWNDGWSQYRIVFKLFDVGFMRRSSPYSHLNKPQKCENSDCEDAEDWLLLSVFRMCDDCVWWNAVYLEHIVSWLWSWPTIPPGNKCRLSVIGDTTAKRSSKSCSHAESCTQEVRTQPQPSQILTILLFLTRNRLHCKLDKPHMCNLGRIRRKIAKWEDSLWDKGSLWVWTLSMCERKNVKLRIHGNSNSVKYRSRNWKIINLAVRRTLGLWARINLIEMISHRKPTHPTPQSFIKETEHPKLFHTNDH